MEIAPLSAFRDDLTTIARQILKESGVSVANLGSDVVRWLESKPWPGDYCQFRRVLLLAHAANSVLSADILESAYSLEPTLPPDAYECSPSRPEESIAAVKLSATTESGSANAAPIEPAAIVQAELSSESSPPSAETQPAPAPKRRERIGAYDFASRLRSSLDAKADAPAPAIPVHPRFATEKK